jgi:hypothetical protein
MAASQPTPATVYGINFVLPGARAQAEGAKCRCTQVMFEAYQLVMGSLSACKFQTTGR